MVTGIGASVIGLITMFALAWAALGGALAVVYVVFACLFFARVYRHAMRTGLIARYSAETVS